MKYLIILRAVCYSAFLLFIYWDSTLWKVSVNMLGEGKTRITYGLLAMALFLGVTLLYNLFFKLLFRPFKKEGTSLPKVGGPFYIIVIIFCFKYCIFGDIGVLLEKESSFEICKSADITPHSDCAIEIKSPAIKDSTLKIYKVGRGKRRLWLERLVSRLLPTRRQVNGKTVCGAIHCGLWG